MTYVHACNSDWSYLEHDDTPGPSETPSTGAELGFWFATAVAPPVGQGFNNYEGCCYFQGKYWLGGMGVWENTAKLVVTKDRQVPSKQVAFPNTVDGLNMNHQCWADDQMKVVKWPGQP